MEYDILEVWGAGGPSTVPLVLHTKETTTKSRTIYSPESRALQQCKNEIDMFYQEGKWDDYKKITNPYEYIFLSWNRRSSRSVSTRQPLSRSYFKMIELWKRLNLTTILADLVKRDGGLLTAHAAEGPGGFIEACSIITERNNWTFNSANAITLRSEAKNVPGWRKAAKFLGSHPQVNIHDGADGTGNILLLHNQDAYVNHVRHAHPLGVHVFTADGGFDFSSDFNAQEDTVLSLLIAETILGLRVLAKGGCLIIKCFDTTEQATLDMLWLLTRAFSEWAMIKPRTSRAGNAERYIIGRGFHGDCDDILSILIAYQARGIFTEPILDQVNCPSYKAMMLSVARLQEQIEHVEIAVIRDTLDLIKVMDAGLIRKLVTDNVARSVAWCEEHLEPVATSWANERDKNVQRETQDLIHILNPPSNVVSYSQSTWYLRPSSSSNLSFQGFRTADNPSTFTQVKK